MPFAPWFSTVAEFDSAVWDSVVVAHAEWRNRLHELAAAVVLGSVARNDGGRRLNTGFVCETALTLVHDKYYLPDENGFWEASWYDRGAGDFAPVLVGDALVGFQICTELWFTDRARAYGKQGVHLIAGPRTTGKAVNKWLVAGRATAVVSGAYCLSSNRCGVHETGIEFGGAGWIIDPDGEVIGITSDDTPFITAEIDLARAEAAKQTYPRYVKD